MSDTKSPKILKLVDKVPTKGIPESIPDGLTLLEVGLFGVLVRELTESQASKTLAALKKQHPDWNELRVCQIQEFVNAISSRSKDTSARMAMQIKAYLQEIFQKNHGFDLERYREDLAEAAKFFADLPVTGAGLAHVMLGMASGGETPVTLGIVRVLDRMGLVKRTSSVKKAMQTLGPLVPAPRRLEFGASLGIVAENYCDAKKPLCWECPLVGECPFGKRVEKDWKAQQVRLEAQRAKEEERRLKEEEKERKKTEAAEQRRQKELEKRRAKEQRIREREAARKSREAERLKKESQKKAAAESKRKKEEAAKKAAAKKAAADKKKAAAAKKAAAKKAAAKAKAAAKKASTKKASSTKKAASAKKPAAKKSAAKKTTSKKATARKTTAKKATSKKATAKKATAKKATTKKPAAKKTTKKPAAKKTTTKKPAAKKSTAKKKATKKKTKSGGRKK